MAALALLFGQVISASAQSSTTAKRTPGSTQAASRLNAEFEQQVKHGDEARLAGRLDEAVAAYGKALRIRPKWADGWWYVGAIFYEKDLYQQARDAFNNFVALDPKRGAAWAMLGLCEFETRDYARAGPDLERGRSLGFDGNQELESVVRYKLALLSIRLGYFEYAYTVLTEFVHVSNESQKIVEAFGLTILRLPILPAEIPADRRELVTLAGQTGISMAARRFDEARKTLDTMLARYPDEPNVHYTFGVFLLNQDADAALKEFRRVLQISPLHQPAMVQMAFEYLKRGEYDTALPFAEKAVELDPKMYPARNALGRVLLELGQTARAIAELEECVRLAPNSPEMHFALARAYARAGRQADAKREQDTFKQLQAEYEARSNPPDNSKDNQPKAKP